MDRKDLVIKLNRDAHFFTSRASRVERLEKIRQIVYLAPDQLLHPEADTEYIVRLGKLRVTQFLDDGSEFTRAVLQAGGLLTVRPRQEHGDNPASDVYTLADMVLMALGETELWSLPLGSLGADR